VTPGQPQRESGEWWLRGFRGLFCTGRGVFGEGAALAVPAVALGAMPGSRPGPRPPPLPGVASPARGRGGTRLFVIFAEQILIKRNT